MGGSLVIFLFHNKHLSWGSPPHISGSPLCTLLTLASSEDAPRTHSTGVGEWGCALSPWPHLEPPGICISQLRLRNKADRAASTAQISSLPTLEAGFQKEVWKGWFVPRPFSWVGRCLSSPCVLHPHEVVPLGISVSSSLRRAPDRPDWGHPSDLILS